MGIFTAMNTSASGLSAQQLRLDIISNNLANVETTRTTEGGAFKRSMAVFRPRNEIARQKSSIFPRVLDPGVGTGVRVVRIEKDNSPGRLVFDPSHPDAIKYGPKKGYVEYPNVNLVKEMTDMISARRSYEANVTAMNAAKQMFVKALDIGLR
jgi:flagellar basal-body rod protein FlgC